MNTIVALAVVVALVLGAWIWQQQSRERAASWAATEGRIVANTVEPVAAPPASRSPPTFVVAVRYEYAVGGQTYRGSRVAFRTPTPFANAAAADRDRARYPEGATVTVYYDPAHPAESVLER